jgi:phosphoribosylformylglycinamidine cyclo-ligase
VSRPGADAYTRAGVDVEAGHRAVELMKASVARTHRPEVIGGLGGFAGLFRLEPGRWREPVLAASTDGVGTKLALARALDRHDTVGLDLVAMVVDDLVVCGAEPLFLQDYVACGRLDPQRVATVVAGIAEGCRIAGAALLGGETAEHPGLLEPDEYDLAATAIGVVEADALLGAHRVQTGDAVLALASSGLHSNGYALVRAVLDRSGSSLDEAFGRHTLGDELLTPTRIYARDCLALASELPVHAFAHITGGGLATNLARSLPAGTAAVVDRSSWSLPAVLDWLARTGELSRADLEATVNLGVGMVAVLPAAALDDAVSLLAERGLDSWACGQVQPASEADREAPVVRLVGEHR